MEAEYVMLRNEIENNMKQMHQYFALTSTAIVALLTFIFNNPNNPNVFIAIFVVLVFIAVRIRRLLEGNISISTYMEVFLESNIDGRNWETFSHYNIEKGPNSHELSKRTSYTNLLLFRTNSMPLFLGIVVYIAYIIVLVNNWSLLNDLSGGIFNTLALLILLYVAVLDANNKDRDSYKRYWNEVKKNLEVGKHDTLV